MKSWLVSAVLAACLIFVVGGRPCAAWMMQPEPEAAHDCCDKSGEHSHGQQSDCELVCALANTRFLPADQPRVEKQQAAAFAAPTVVESPVPAISPLRTRPTFRAPDHAPPLYLLNAAFLV